MRGFRNLRELMEKVSDDNKPFDNFEISFTVPDGGKRTVLLNARKIDQEGSEPRRILLAIEDITE